MIIIWDRDYRWGVRVPAILAHAGGVLYGTELGSVTLKRVSFFCFPIKHSTHTPSKIPEFTPSVWTFFSLLIC